MVPNLSKGAGIKGTALYVLHDVRDEGERAIGAALTPELQSQHRVGLTITRNLSTDDPELAWRLMCATAKAQAELKQAAGIRAGGRQTKNFCGHISLSWEHQTRPDAAEIQRAAEGVLTALGWEKLQALIVEHKEKDHSHCHIVVNLVDPETGRTAPNTKNDYEKLQRWAHEYDKARGIEACPERAQRMERTPDAPMPTPPAPAAPAKRWLSRQEYEVIREAERAEHIAAAVARYRESAAAVREQFRPAWAALYGEQRDEQRALDKEQRSTLHGLQRAAVIRTKRVQDAAERGWLGPPVEVRNRMVEFVNAHRAEIFLGIDPAAQPTHEQLLTPSYVKAALERAHMSQRADLAERHGEAKTELQARHTEARQEAYRAAWKRPEPVQGKDTGPKAPTGPAQPEPAQVVPIKPDAPAAPEKAERRGFSLAAALAASAAGIAAYAITRQQKAPGDRPQDPVRDPVQDRALDSEREIRAAAARIQRGQSRPANANEIARVLKAEPPVKRELPTRATEASKQPEEPAKAQTQRGELDALRAKAEARNAELRRQHLEAAAARAAERAQRRAGSRDRD